MILYTMPFSQSVEAAVHFVEFCSLNDTTVTRRNSRMMRCDVKTQLKAMDFSLNGWQIQ